MRPVDKLTVALGVVAIVAGIGIAAAEAADAAAWVFLATLGLTVVAAAVFLWRIFTPRPRPAAPAPPTKYDQPDPEWLPIAMAPFATAGRVGGDHVPLTYWASMFAGAKG